MFLEIVEGRCVELALAGHRKLFVELGRGGLFLADGLFGFLFGLGGLIFGQELVEILARVSSLEVGYAFGQKFILGMVFLEGLCVFFLEENSHVFCLLHC